MAIEGNVQMMLDAMLKIRRELNTYCNGCTLIDRMTENPPDYTCLRDSLLEIDRIVESALSAPPRNCDVMSVESARKVWFEKEIMPRLDGDLPLGKEIPFEDWFVSQQEQGEGDGSK